MQQVSVVNDRSGYVWCLLTQASKREEPEEVVFMVNRIICGLDLPLVYSLPKLIADKPLIMLQKVTLTGMGASTFKDCMNAMREVSMIAEWEFKQGALEQWTPTSINGVKAMEITNRYFRRTREGDSEEPLTISKDVDPKGVLQQLMRLDLVHTEENVVHYFRSTIKEGGKRKYQVAKPQLFWVGDIIEAQITLAIVRGKKRTHRIKLILRAIVLLDAEYTQARSGRQSKSDRGG
ncbi:hypothetical protein EDD85DRAFT_785224 [Armillaria nabsnona]|nr:hypothetical protein EDD85DRAFT_785224 [Armillaria nabsnona]